MGLKVMMEKMIAIIKKDVFDESTDIELDC